METAISTASRDNWKRRAIVTLASIGVAVAFTSISYFCYSNIFGYPLIFVEVDPASGSLALSGEDDPDLSYYTAAVSRIYSNRPVTSLSFYLNHLLWGSDPFLWHLSNWALHVATGLLCLLLLFQVLKIPGVWEYRTGSPGGVQFYGLLLASAAAALLWTVHPVHSQAVVLVEQRATCLAGAFSLIALNSFVGLRTVRRAWLQKILTGVCGLAVVLALGSKETTVLLPLFIGFFEWAFFRNLDTDWLRAHWRYAAALAGGVFVLVAIQLFWFPSEILFKYQPNAAPWWQRLLSTPRMIGIYLGLLALPYPGRLNIDHGMAFSTAFNSPPSTWIAISILTVAVIAAVWMRRRERLLSFAVLWFVLFLVVEAGFDDGRVVSEQRLYLPSMLLISALVCRCWGWITPKKYVAVGAALIIALASYWTIQRNSVWQNELALWQDTLEKTPAGFMANRGLGNHYLRSGQILKAKKHLRAAMEVRPQDPRLLYAYGKASFNGGGIPVAIEYFERTLAYYPGFKDAEDAIITARQRLNEITIANALRRLKEHPRELSLHHRLGVLYVAAGQRGEAMKFYRQALSIDPAHVPTLKQTARLLVKEGKYPKALASCIRSLYVDPEDPEIYYMIGTIKALQNDHAGSVAWIRKAIEKGFSNYNDILSSQDLNQVRHSPQFAKLLSEIPHANRL